MHTAHIIILNVKKIEKDFQMKYCTVRYTTKRSASKIFSVVIVGTLNHLLKIKTYMKKL